MANFDLARVTVSPNPGGIKEYRVTITEGP
jgi:hypothetical protein